MSIKRRIGFTLGMAVALAPWALAQTPAPTPDVYTPDQLEAMEQTLQQKADSKGLATQTIKKYATDYSMLAFRSQSGQAELHEKFADFYVVMAGEATLVSGGEMVNSKTISTGEVRADSIKGGQEAKLKKGDIIHIPANIPHQLVLAKGDTFQYFIVKVQEIQ
jgi:mannose-6-phosphate isomerase-like protein (cupin superfamily)